VLNKFSLQNHFYIDRYCTCIYSHTHYTKNDTGDYINPTVINMTTYKILRCTNIEERLQTAIALMDAVPNDAHVKSAVIKYVMDTFYKPLDGYADIIDVPLLEHHNLFEKTKSIVEFSNWHNAYALGLVDPFKIKYECMSMYEEGNYDIKESFDIIQIGDIYTVYSFKIVYLPNNALKAIETFETFEATIRVQIIEEGRRCDYWMDEPK
jgi:hypothetical protein